MGNFYSGSEFNRYVNLDGLEWRIVAQLLDSNSKYAENIWKLLKYDTEDCLFKDNLTREEKVRLIYRDTGLSTDKKVFMMPYIDDAWEVQGSRLDIYVDKVVPTNRMASTINIRADIIVYNKINNIYGEAEEGVETTNPSELDGEGNVLIPSKSRATVLLKSVLAELNGTFVAGVGDLQHNGTMSISSDSEKRVWSNRGYMGYEITFSTLLAGDSLDSQYGY